MSTNAQVPTGELRDKLLAGADLDVSTRDLAGAATTILTAGDGPPLVLLHGGIECGGIYWAPAVSLLTSHYRVVIPDVPGFGESPPFARFGTDTFNPWLSALLAWTGPEPPVVLAHSLFGTLTARFAATSAPQMRALIVSAAPGIGPYRMPARLRVVAMRYGLHPTAANAERFQRFALLDREKVQRRDPAWLAAFTAYSMAKARVPHAKDTMRQLLKLGTLRIPVTEARQIAVPAALIWGRHDRMVPLQSGQSAATALGWPLHVIDDAAHVPHIEVPTAFAETVSRAVSSSLLTGGSHDIHR